MFNSTEYSTLLVKDKKGQLLRRFTAFIVCVSLVCAFFLSTTFLFANANHEHDHNGPDESCVTCIHMEYAQNLVNQIATAVILTSLISRSLFCVLFLLNYIIQNSRFLTPVTLKVRMNN